MLAMKAVRLLLGELLAADASTLAPAVTPNKIALIKEAFVEDETLEAADLDLADFDGSTPIAGAAGTQQVGIDPATLDQVITVKDPVGGYRWETTGLTNLPQSIYGFGLFDTTLGTLLGVQLFPEPLTLDAVGQEINIGKAQMTVVAQPLS